MNDGRARNTGRSRKKEFDVTRERKFVRLKRCKTLRKLRHSEAAAENSREYLD